MARDRDVAAFGERAQGYDEGGVVGCITRSPTARRTWLVPGCQPRGGYSTSGAGPATCLAGLPLGLRRPRSWPYEVSAARVRASFHEWLTLTHLLVDAVPVIVRIGVQVRTA